ncbi:MAG: hypothetical protein AAEJ52_16660, partial [Myxococcota bacterium]
ETPATTAIGSLDSPGSELSAAVESRGLALLGLVHHADKVLMSAWRYDYSPEQRFDFVGTCRPETGLGVGF